MVDQRCLPPAATTDSFGDRDTLFFFFLGAKFRFIIVLHCVKVRDAEGSAEIAPQRAEGYPMRKKSSRYTIEAMMFNFRSAMMFNFCAAMMFNFIVAVMFNFLW